MWDGYSLVIGQLVGLVGREISPLNTQVAPCKTHTLQSMNYHLKLENLKILGIQNLNKTSQKCKEIARWA